MKTYNVINKDFEIIFEGEFDDLDMFISSNNKPLLKVNQNEKEKIIDLNGLPIIDDEYDKISKLEIGNTKNYYIVYKNNKFGYLNEDGSKITDIKFEEFSSYHNKNFKNGFAFVIEKRSKKFINENGQQFIDIESSVAYGFDNGLALLKKDGLFGFIDTNGNDITGYIYNNAYRFTENGHGLVAKNSGWGIIDIKGNILLNFVYDEITYLVSNSKNLATKNLFKIKKEKLYSFIDLIHKINPKYFYKEVKYSSEGFFIVKKDKFWGIVSLNEEEIVPLKYDEIRILNKVAFTKKGAKYDILDLENKIQILYKCDKYYLSNKAYIIKIKENYSKIQFDGNKISEININQIEDIEIFTDNIIIGLIKNKYGVINFNGEVLIDFKYDVIKLELDKKENQYFIVTRDNLSGVINKDYKTILETKYDYIILQRGSYFEVKINILKQILNLDGKKVNEIEYEYLNSLELENQLYIIGNYNKGSKVSKTCYLVSRENKNSKDCKIIILSKFVDETLYIVATGYAGGGFWGEIMAKITTTNDWTTSRGVFTNLFTEDEWKYKYDDSDCAEIDEIIEENDYKILNQLVEELNNKYIYYEIDNDEVIEIPLLTKEFKGKIKSKTYDYTGNVNIYKNLSRHWGIFYRW